MQVHPTAFIDPKNPGAPVKFLAPEALRGAGGVLINHYGVRFVNELAPRDTVTGAMYLCADTSHPFHGFANADEAAAAAHTCHTAAPRNTEALLVLDQQAVDIFGAPAFAFYHRVKGFFTMVDGAVGLTAYIASLNGAPNSPNVSVVASTLDDLTAAANKAIVDKLGRTSFASLFTNASSAHLYVARVTGAIHYTMGGLAIDSFARVLRRHSDACETQEQCESGSDGQSQGTPIPGLYAAGEVTGGVHGANRLAGNSLLECVVYGRTAAESAVAFAVSIRTRTKRDL